MSNPKSYQVTFTSETATDDGTVLNNWLGETFASEKYVIEDVTAYESGADQPCEKAA